MFRLDDKVAVVTGGHVFLDSPESDFITGQIIYVDGGLTAMA
ncbi:hypothetical protein ACFLVB_01330 [Chloroflexota bacterium]